MLEETKILVDAIKGSVASEFKSVRTEIQFVSKSFDDFRKFQEMQSKEVSIRYLKALEDLSGVEKENAKQIGGIKENCAIRGIECAQIIKAAKEYINGKQAKKSIWNNRAWQIMHSVFVFLIACVINNWGEITRSVKLYIRGGQS